MTERRAALDVLAVSLLIGFNVLLGLNQALVKVVNAGFSPVFQAGLRSICAFLPVLLFAWFMRRRLSISDGSLPWGLTNGLLFSVEFALLFIALDFTTVARVSLFFYMMPVWVALAAHFLIPEEPLNRNKIMGLGLAIGGAALGLSGDLGDAGASAWLGDLLALLAGTLWASIALVTRLKLSHVSSEMNLLYQLFVSGIVLTGLGIALGDPIRSPTSLIYGVFLFQVLVIVAAGFLVWFWVLQHYPVSNMASLSLITPVVGVYFGWLIFDDPITSSLGLALILIGAGIILVNRPVCRTAPGAPLP